MKNDDKRLSKLLSFILRHHPEHIGLSPDKNGWVRVDILIAQLNAHSYIITEDRLKEIVDTNNKKRFAFNEDNTMIRISQGHSIEIDLALRSSTPPQILYHGTATKNLDSIFSTGLQKGDRQHVHLSDNEETARNVGSRHGRPVVLQVDAGEMHKEGFIFFLSENGVWLTEYVPIVYLNRKYG